MKKTKDIIKTKTILQRNLTDAIVHLQIIGSEHVNFMLNSLRQKEDECQVEALEE